MVTITEIFCGPVPVAWLQHYCGVRWRNPDPTCPIFPRRDSERKRTASRDRDKYEAGERDYEISNPHVYWCARAASELAGEPFYYVFYPACAWVFDIHVARRALFMLSVAMYVGQALKDIMRRPRPHSPPVIRLEKTYETEFGLPSTHTVCGIVAPFSMLLFASLQFKLPTTMFAFWALLWSSSVMLSRLYLGMHSILDVASGALLSAATMLAIDPVAIWFDNLQLACASPLPSLLLSLGGVALTGALYAVDDVMAWLAGGEVERRWSTSRGDTTEIVGWLVGFFIGSRSLHLWQSQLAPGAIFSGPPGGVLSAFTGLFPRNPAFSHLRRFVVGSAILGPVTWVARKLLRKAFTRLSGAGGIPGARRLRSVEWPYKFSASFSAAFAATFLIPRVFSRCGWW